ncbi:MAG: hypothetical protein HQK96_17600 [Nitrospirae bacterium]|nr:hypothetical protein [Nitrospirota bacterium]
MRDIRALYKARKDAISQASKPLEVVKEAVQPQPAIAAIEPRAEAAEPQVDLPCVRGGELIFERWHFCKDWSMKYHGDSRRLQRVCRLSGAWCLRLNQDGDKASIEPSQKTAARRGRNQ